MSHVMGKKGMHIKICYAAMDKYHLTRYKELQNSKVSRKGFINYYS